MKKMLVKCCLIILLLSIGAGGCWDRRELESLGLVQALGLDLGPDGKGITVTTMIAIPPKISAGASSGGSGGGEGKESGVFTISINAPTIYEGFNLINTTINREITLIQNSVLFIGEDLARQGVRQWIDTLVRFREMRRTVLIFICKRTAAEIMQIQPKLEKNPAQYFADLSKLSYRNGMFPIVNLNNFMSNFEALVQENYAPILAKYQPPEPGRSGQKQKDKDSKKENLKNGSSKQDQKPAGAEGSIRVIGTAVFKRDKMMGTFDIYESQILQLLTGEFREALLSLPDPLQKGYIAYRLLATTFPKIKYNHRGGDHIKAKFRLEADILSLQSGENYTIPSKEVILGKWIARKLKGRITKVIQKAQNKYGSDVFGFGKTVRQTFLTSSAWEKYRWPDRFPEADIQVNVKVAIRRVGVQFQPPQLRR